MCDLLAAFPFLLIWTLTIFAAVAWGMDVLPLWRKGRRWKSAGAALACLACAAPTIEVILLMVWIDSLSK